MEKRFSSIPAAIDFLRGRGFEAHSGLFDFETTWRIENVPDKLVAYIHPCERGNSRTEFRVCIFSEPEVREEGR